jgi:carboxypeptidase C (cathepsin A)
MMRLQALAAAILAATMAVGALSALVAEEGKKPTPKAKEAAPQAWREEEHAVDATLNIGERAIPYRAVAGSYPLKDDKGKVKAHFFYVAYTRSDIEDHSERPIAFCFNGGPGAASVWMHMGLLGPKRVQLEEGAARLPPYSYVENKYSLLDVVDLVFIDPISTGYSRALAGEDDKQYHSVDEDVKSIGEFIRLYTTRNMRWLSPKFLVGASYGSLRAVELSSYLYDQYNMAINGAVLISSVLNFETINPDAHSNELPYLLYLPSYTATAFAHQKLPAKLQADLPAAIEQAKSFALQDYAFALLQGDKLPIERRKEIASQLALYTGLSAQAIERMNLRIAPVHYMQELLGREGKVVGRFDSRQVGYAINRCSGHLEYDPSMDAIFSAFTAAFNEYMRSVFKLTKDDEYRVLANVMPWSYGKDQNRYFSAVATLREVLIRVPKFSLFVACGYYDLATPFLAADYTFSHLNLIENVNDRLTMKYYSGGHMMYTDQEALQALSHDLHLYFQSAVR